MTAEYEDKRPGEDEAPDSGFEEERERYVREHPGDPESGDDAQESDGGNSAEESPPDDSEASALEQDIGELQEKARERDEYLALAQRAQADFENYRKRVSKDVASAEA